MEERKIIIFTALEIERRAVARAVRDLTPAFGPSFSGEDPGATPGLRNKEDAKPIEVIAIGIRAVRDSAWQRALHSAAQSGGVTLIVAGLGGGLDPTLRVGDVVIDARDEPRLIGLPFHFGSIHTAANLICTRDAKSELFRSTGALAVDMESALVRRVAVEYAMPIIGVRAISDAADVAIDPQMISLVDELGRPRAGRIALALIKDPARALALRRLGRDTRLALRQLEVAVRRIVDRLNRDPVSNNL